MFVLNQKEIILSMLNTMILFGKAFVNVMPWYGWMILGAIPIIKFAEKKFRILTR